MAYNDKISKKQGSVNNQQSSTVDSNGTIDNLPNPSVRKINQIIMFTATVLQILIGFRIFLKLIAANPQSGFASFIYGITDLFLFPFAGLTATPASNGAVLEIPAIIAMIAYAFLFWLLTYLVRIIMK
ncbi:MAG TPA: YggT family protein [Anaerolineae bacterium]|nr:YggT family protein [Anaerolineae bacterium]